MPSQNETVIKLRIDQTGNAPRQLKDATTAAKALGDATARANQELSRQGRTMEEQARAEINRVKQRKQLQDEVTRQYRQMGLDARGNPIMPTAGAGRSLAAGAVGTGLQSIGLGGLGGAMGLGAAGPLAVGVAAVAGIKAAAEGVIRGMGDLAEAEAKSYMSSIRREQAISQSHPLNPVSGLERGWQRYVHGKYAAPTIEANRLKYGPQTVAMETQMGLSPELFSKSMMAAKSDAEAQAASGIRYGAMPGIDRSTAGGVISHREAQMRLGADDDIVRARRGLHVAESMAAKSIAAERTAVDGLGTAQKNQRAAAEAIEKQRRYEESLANRPHGIPRDRDIAKSRAIMDTLLQEKAKADLEVQEKLDRLKEAQNAKEQAGVNLAQQRAAVNKAIVGQMQTELNILQQREQMLAGSAQRMGGQHKGTRMMGAAAMRFLDQHGIGNATPDILAAAQGFAPLEMQKRMEKFGEQTPEFQEGKKRGYADFQGGRLGDIRDRQDNLVNQMRDKMQENDEQLAKGIADAMALAMRDFQQMIVKFVEQAMQRFKTGELQRRNQP